MVTVKFDMIAWLARRTCLWPECLAWWIHSVQASWRILCCGTTMAICCQWGSEMLSTGAFGMLICWKRLNFGGLWYICNLQSLPNMFGIFSSPYSPKKSASSICEKFAAMQKGLGVSGHLQLQTHFALMARGDPAWPCHAILDLTSSPEKQRHWRSCGARLEDAVVTGSSRFSKFKAELQESNLWNLKFGKEWSLFVSRDSFLNVMLFLYRFVFPPQNLIVPRHGGLLEGLLRPGIGSVIFPASLLPFSSQNAMAMCGQDCFCCFKGEPKSPSHDY